MENLNKLFPEKEGIYMVLQSPVLVKNLWLQTDLTGHFSNNYFDLLPDESYRVMFKTKASLKEFEKGFEMMSLSDLGKSQEINGQFKRNILCQLRQRNMRFPITIGIA